MQFTELDSVLEKWSKLNGLFLAKEFKDSPVRSWNIVDKKGREYQMWIEIEDKGIRIQSSDQKSNRWSEFVKPAELNAGLSRGLSVIENWMGVDKPKRILN